MPIPDTLKTPTFAAPDSPVATVYGAFLAKHEINANVWVLTLDDGHAAGVFGQSGTVWHIDDDPDVSGGKQAGLSKPSNLAHIDI